MFDNYTNEEIHSAAVLLAAQICLRSRNIFVLRVRGEISDFVFRFEDGIRGHTVILVQEAINEAKRLMYDAERTGKIFLSNMNLNCLVGNQIDYYVPTNERYPLSEEELALMLLLARYDNSIIPEPVELLS